MDTIRARSTPWKKTHGRYLCQKYQAWMFGSFVSHHDFLLYGVPPVAESTGDSTSFAAWPKGVDGITRLEGGRFEIAEVILGILFCFHESPLKILYSLLYTHIPRKSWKIRKESHGKWFGECFDGRTCLKTQSFLWQVDKMGILSHPKLRIFGRWGPPMAD